MSKHIKENYERLIDFKTYEGFQKVRQALDIKENIMEPFVEKIHNELQYLLT